MVSGPDIMKVMVSDPISDDLERLGAPSDSLLAVHTRRMVRINHPELKLLQQSRYEEEQLGLGENLSETHATPYNIDTVYMTRARCQCYRHQWRYVCYVDKLYLYTGELLQHDPFRRNFV